MDKIIESAMEQMRSMVKSDTILGEPLRMGEDIMIIPVCKIRFGFGSGGGDKGSGKSGSGFGGAGSVDPVGFLTVIDGAVSLMSFKNPTGTLDRVLEQVPDLIEKLSRIKRADKEKDAAADKQE
ncbi:MAG: spore germination protein GerW family protein [Candidatus Alcyoniella australis]|nr:spore germination protein GerW family protein [Candidatus Alcyoniella australis]